MGVKTKRKGEKFHFFFLQWNFIVAQQKAFIVSQRRPEEVTKARRPPLSASPSPSPWSALSEIYRKNFPIAILAIEWQWHPPSSELAGNCFEKVCGCAGARGFANWRHNCALVSRCLAHNGAFKMGVACTLNAAHLLMDKYVNGSKSFHYLQYFANISLVGSLCSVDCQQQEERPGLPSCRQPSEMFFFSFDRLLSV